MSGVTETEGEIDERDREREREREREVEILRRRETQDEPLFICSSCVCVCVPPCNIKADACCIPHELFRLQATVTLFRLCNLHFQVCSTV